MKSDRENVTARVREREVLSRARPSLATMSLEQHRSVRQVTSSAALGRADEAARRGAGSGLGHRGRLGWEEGHRRGAREEAPGGWRDQPTCSLGAPPGKPGGGPGSWEEAGAGAPPACSFLPTVSNPLCPFRVFAPHL